MNSLGFYVKTQAANSIVQAYTEFKNKLKRRIEELDNEIERRNKGEKQSYTSYEYEDRCVVSKSVEDMKNARDEYKFWLNLKVADIMKGVMVSKYVKQDTSTLDRDFDDFQDFLRMQLVILDLYDRDFIDINWTLDKLIENLRKRYLKDKEDFIL